jgi:hypothetical protein
VQYKTQSEDLPPLFDTENAYAECGMEGIVIIVCNKTGYRSERLAGAVFLGSNVYEMLRV